MIRRLAVLGLAVFALGGCGDDRPFPIRGYYSTAQHAAVLSRQRYNLDYNYLRSFHRELLSEEWVAIDNRDFPIRGSRLRFHSLTQHRHPTYWFEMCLPLKIQRNWYQPRTCPHGSIYIRGETHGQRARDGSFRGIIQLPYMLAGSHVLGHIEPTKIGPVLYLSFDRLDRYSMDYLRSEWDFQRHSLVAPRLEEDKN